VVKTRAQQLVVCIDHKGYAASLEKRKIYIVLRDAAAEKHGLLRIVDESGEDYLYPKKSFRPIALPQAVKRAVLSAQELGPFGANLSATAHRASTSAIERIGSTRRRDSGSGWKPNDS
jgi:hypothetical protein